MSEATQTERRKCWNCRQLVDKDPCPVCNKSLAEYSNADQDKLNAHLFQMAEHAR